MKKLFCSFLLSVILATSIMPVSAQSGNILPNNLPENIVEEIRKSNEDIKVIDDAQFILGDTLYVDVSKSEEENDEPNITLFASKMPTKTWNWNK